MSKQVQLTVRAKAFSGEGVRQHRVIVDGQIIRVYDSVADYYTTMHDLRPSAQRRILKIARNTFA